MDLGFPLFPYLQREIDGDLSSSSLTSFSRLMRYLESRNAENLDISSCAKLDILMD